jgi:ABC-type transport system involved in multi-copper enzyme maturation permease subunit
MFWNVTLVEQSKLLRRRLLGIELAILALLIGSMGGLIYGVIPRLPGEEAPPLLWSAAVTTLLTVAGNPMFGGILAVVLVGAMTAQAYQWRTIHLWLSHGTPRRTLLGAKLLALLPALLLLPLVALLVAAPLTALLLPPVGGTLDIAAIGSGGLLWTIVAAGLGLLPYVALALLLAVLTRTPVAPIGVGIGFIVAEGIGSSLLTSMAIPILDRLLAFLPAHLAGGLHGAVPGLHPAAALAGVLAWSLLFLVPAFLIFERQDLTD